MRRTVGHFSGLLQGWRSRKGKDNYFTTLWNKPETKDERIKEYIPEVLQESLEEQTAVRAESTSRDVIVELGHKILVEIENRSPTPSIAPHLNKLLLEYNLKEAIAQRPLSYLLYPTSLALGGDAQPHELVASFADNFRSMIEEVENHGRSIRCCRGVEGTAGEGERGVPKDGDAAAVGGLEAVPVAHERTMTVNDTSVGQPVPIPSTDEYEPMDVTLFVKIVSGLALANMHCGDLRNAVRCVDAGIAHVIDSTRLGGLLALKAGLLIRQKKYAEAASSAKLAVETSCSIQGYLHGAYALRMLHRSQEAVALLEKGVEEYPMNTDMAALLESTKKSSKLSLPAS